jgi:hypothetical protein
MEDLSEAVGLILEQEMLHLKGESSSWNWRTCLVRGGYLLINQGSFHSRGGSFWSHKGSFRAMEDLSGSLGAQSEAAWDSPFRLGLINEWLVKSLKQRY